MKIFLPIVYSIDDNYTLPVMVAIKSLQRSKKREINLKIYIFNAGLKDENKNKILTLKKEDCQIEFVCVSEFLIGAEFYACHDFSEAMYYRFFIPQILSEYEKVLYLDTDTVVTNCVSKIFEEDLSGFALGACYDYGMMNNPNVSKNYVNSGVILYNCVEFNKCNFADKCVDFVNNNKNLSYPDQDTINYVCQGKIKLLSPTYNFLTVLCWDYDSMGTNLKNGLKVCKINNKKNVIVWHYAGLKPWAIKSTPLANKWWNFVKYLPHKTQKEIKEYYKTKKSETIEYYHKVTSKKYYNPYIVKEQYNKVQKFKLKIKNLFRR